MQTESVGATILKLDSYRDNSTIIVVPTRGMVPSSVVVCWLSLTPIMNSVRSFSFIEGGEVGDSYNKAMEQIVAGNWGEHRYVMTLEEDNLIPRDAHIRLVQGMEGGWDMLASLYYTKSDPSYPLALGDPAIWKERGYFDNLVDFQSIDISEHEKNGDIVEVNGAPMGCTIYKTEIFKEIGPPWFVTKYDYPRQGQDLHFCEKLQKAGKRIAVHCGLRVGHLDTKTKKVY